MPHSRGGGWSRASGTIPAVTGSTPTRGPVSIISPLRYPGAKRRLSTYVEQALQLNGIVPKVLAEPFAGGASVALHLLQAGAVEHAVLGDLDPLVAGFWQTVFGPTQQRNWLIKQVRETPVTVEKWDECRSVSDNASRRRRAFACLFLNRTSFSGILSKSAGPIGGRTQRSRYKIDCRFPRERLVRRIEQAADLRAKVTVLDACGWAKTVRAAEGRGGELFLYLDPPFYEGAARLYRHHFDEAGHQSMHDDLLTFHRHAYILSYDAARPIVDLYSHNGRGPKRIDLLYAAAGNRRTEELVVTNLRRLPDGDRIWKTHAEWNAERTTRQPNSS